VHGTVRAGAPLAGLLPAVEERLRQRGMSSLRQRSGRRRDCAGRGTASPTAAGIRDRDGYPLRSVS
jgi:hypothetical protein